MAPPIVLASQSPRRSQLLELIGLRFEVLPADLDETYLPHETPPQHARRLAEEKARAVAALRPEALVVGSDTVVILDGDVLGKPRDRSEALQMLMRLQGREHEVLTGVAVVSPTGAASASVAEEPLVLPDVARLPEDLPSVAGTPPQATGAADSAGSAGGAGATGEAGAGAPAGDGAGEARIASGVEAVRVRFREFDEATALEYIATGEPMDKAGAYGIQGFGATIVECIEGDYFAVMGLPIGRMIGLFRQLGWRYNFRGLESL